MGELLFMTYTLLKCFLVLHPRHKLHYFKQAKWEPEWIETAEAIVRAEFERSYATEVLDGVDEDGPSAKSVCTG